MSEPGEFTYRRTHQASRELLFDCMTRPAHLTQFWGPAGTTTPLDGITVELRPGGRFDTVMVSQADGSQFTTHAIYLAVERPDKLVWQEADVEGGMITTITFTELDDGQTEVVTHQTNVPSLYASAEARTGFETSLRRFEDYVAAVASS